MRKLAITLVPLFLAACTGEPTAPDPTQLKVMSPPQTMSAASNAAYRETFRNDFDISWLLTPAEFPCLSEAIQLDGTIEEFANFVDSKGSIHFTYHQTTKNMTVVGVTTGDRYAFSGPLTFSASGSTSQNEPLEQTYHNINHFVGPGADTNIYLRTLIHLTRDATTGEVKVEIFKDEVLCH